MINPKLLGWMAAGSIPDLNLYQLAAYELQSDCHLTHYQYPRHAPSPDTPGHARTLSLSCRIPAGSSGQRPYNGASDRDGERGNEWVGVVRGRRGSGSGEERGEGGEEEEGWGKR